MGRRNAVPLYKSRHVAFVNAIHETSDSDKAMAAHLHIGTGPRVDTIAHTHSSWFRYRRDGSLYYKIPASDPCRKYGDTSPCGDCAHHSHTKYEPKTPAGEGREILIKNEWTNPVTGEREYFGLRDAVESYFSLSGTHAPDGVQHGNEMINGNGISSGQLNTWYRDIGALAVISKDAREDRLREEIEVEEDRDQDQIKDFGRDGQGNEIPDIITHDFRATFCTHLMRNNVPRTKAITKTGHKDPDSMQPYIKFAEDEIDAAEEDQFY